MTAVPTRQAAALPPALPPVSSPPGPTRWAPRWAPRWEPANALVAAYLAAAAIPPVAAVGLGRTPATWLAAPGAFLAAPAWCARPPPPSRPAPAGGADGLAVLAPW